MRAWPPKAVSNLFPSSAACFIWCSFRPISMVPADFAAAVVDRRPVAVSSLPRPWSAAARTKLPYDRIASVEPTQYQKLAQFGDPLQRQKRDVRGARSACLMRHIMPGDRV